MGRKTWATEEQNEWLTERKKRFVDAQLNKTSREFLKSTTQCFIEKWPVAEPTDQEVAAEGGLEEAREAKLNTQRTQIDNWFRNHTRNSAGASKANTVVLSLARKKVQMLMPYQAYMRLHRTRIMEPIKEAYEKYRKDLPEGKELRNWWPWACEEAARMLSEEPETVQAEVEAFRVKLFQEQTPTALAMEDLMKDGPEHATKKVRALQNAISMVGRTGLEALKAVEDQTAWKGTLLLGGPDPETGRLVTVAIHNGRTLNLGNMFSEAMEAWPQIQAAFDKFIGQCFPPELAEELEKIYSGELPDLEGMQKSGNNSPAPNASIPALPTTSQPEASPSLPSPPAPSSAAPPTSLSLPPPKAAPIVPAARPSMTPEPDYEEERQKTVRRNKKILKAIKGGATYEEACAMYAGDPESSEEELEEPEWIAPAREYLEGVSEEAWWQELMGLWVDFERLLRYIRGNTRLSAKSHPEEVKVWISRGRNYEKPPKVKSVEILAREWRKWWSRLQPTCRRDADSHWPLHQRAPQEDSQWSEIKRGGCNGLFMIIMCLSWWVQSAGTCLQDAREAVEDVSWALRALGSDTPLTTTATCSSPARVTDKVAGAATLDPTSVTPDPAPSSSPALTTPAPAPANSDPTSVISDPASVIPDPAPSSLLARTTPVPAPATSDPAPTTSDPASAMPDPTPAVAGPVFAVLYPAPAVPVPALAVLDLAPPVPGSLPVVPDPTPAIPCPTLASPNDATDSSSATSVEPCPSSATFNATVTVSDPMPTLSVESSPALSKRVASVMEDNSSPELLHVAKRQKTPNVGGEDTA